MRMPEYTPVYVVTGFLDSGKTSLLNQLLSRRLESGHSLCCIQFEQGEQALEQDLIDRGNLDLLHFPVRKLQSGAGMQQVSKQIYDYLLRNDPEELWIEWNGTLPISVLQTLFPPAKKQDGGTPGDFCQLQRMLYLADSTKLDALLQQTGGMVLEQISASDVIVLRNWGPVSQFKNRKRMLRELNPGVKVLPLNSVGTVERAMLRPGRQPAFWFLLGIAYFTAAYLTLRMVIGAGGNLADAVVNVFLGILLQAFPFLLIGVLLSSAIQIFVSQQWLHEHFPKHLAGGLLFAALAGFCLPVCDCASVPVFRSLVRKGVPPAAAVTFLMAAPVINPVVILSTWYAFSGDVRIVLCRVGLGLLCAVLIGLTFSQSRKERLEPVRLRLVFLRLRLFCGAGSRGRKALPLSPPYANGVFQCWEVPCAGRPGIRPVPDSGQVISVGERRGWAVPSSPGADGNGIFSLSLLLRRRGGCQELCRTVPHGGPDGIYGIWPYDGYQESDPALRRLFA